MIAASAPNAGTASTTAASIAATIWSTSGISLFAIMATHSKIRAVGINVIGKVCRRTLQPHKQGVPPASSPWLVPLAGGLAVAPRRDEYVDDLSVLVDGPVHVATRR